MAGVLGGLVLSFLADTRYLQHSLKAMILGCLFASVVSLVWFELSVQSMFYNKHILSSTVVTIGLSTCLVGLLTGAASPLVYEALAEIMFPLPESLSASILVQWINVGTLIFLFIAPNRDQLVNFLILVVLVVTIVLVILTRFTYARRDEDERKRIEKERSQLMHQNGIHSSIQDINGHPQLGAVV